MDCPCCGSPDLRAIYAMTEQTPTGCVEWMGRRMKNGYGRIGHTLAHRAVMEALVGPLPPTVQVLHHCDNPPCIRRDHLFLGSQADNVQDMWAKGRGKAGPLKGSQIAQSKLVEAQVAEIKQLLREGRSTYSLGREFGVSRTTIGLIKRGIRWTHVA